MSQSTTQRPPIPDPSRHTYADIPAKWEVLTAMRPLRPIHDENELAEATRVIDVMAGHDLNRDQRDYLDALATLVAAYEDEHHPVDVGRVSGVRILRSLMEDHRWDAADLARLLSLEKNEANEILRGERRLDLEHRRALGRRFHLHPDVFVR